MRSLLVDGRHLPEMRQAEVVAGPVSFAPSGLPPIASDHAEGRPDPSEVSYSPQRCNDYELLSGVSEVSVPRLEDEGSCSGEDAARSRRAKRRAVEASEPSVQVLRVPVEPFGATAFGSCVDARFWALPDRERVRLPWEQGVAKQIFGGGIETLKMPWERPQVPRLFSVGSTPVPVALTTREETADRHEDVHFARIVSLAADHSDEVAKYES